jgi:hypothetical protein
VGAWILLVWGYVRLKSGQYICGLKISLEDCDGVVLGCDIAEILWTTTRILTL